MKRMLIVACSDRKVADPGRIPAIERYDGPAFRVLRKYLREHCLSGLSIYVLSARFGLIPASHEIPDYNQTMTSKRANELRSKVSRALAVGVRRDNWAYIGVSASKSYLPILDDLDSLICKGTKISILGGGLGRRLTALHSWLRQTI